MKIKVLAPTRVPLQARAGCRILVVALFSRLGSKAVGAHQHQTVLLTNVRDAETGDLLAEHLWFNRGNLWRKARIDPGDVVTFEARSIEYRTGYWGPDPIRRLDEPPRRDYCLTPPVSLQVIRRAHGQYLEAA